MTWRKARKARGARDTELAPLCSLNAGSKFCKRHFKVRRASHLCRAARGKACPGAKSCSSHWQGVPGCARNVPQYTPNSGGRSCPFPGHPGTAPKLLPEEMWESRSCSLTMLGGPAGTGKSQQGRAAAAPPPVTTLLVIKVTKSNSGQGPWHSHSAGTKSRGDGFMRGG